jgi:hypothetical protein
MVTGYRLSAIGYRLIDRRRAFRGLAVLFGGSAFAEFPSGPIAARRGHHHGNGRNPRKRLRKQCRQQCNGVHHDCIDLYCHILGYADDICHSQCAIAKQSCQRGCG